MKCSTFGWCLALVAGMSVGMLGSSTWAAERSPIEGEAASGHETVEMFKAMEAGDIEVTMIPKDASEATILIKNKSKKPLAVSLPEAFVGVPVMAQFGGGGGGFGGGGGGFGGGAGGGSQGVGGGFGGMGGMGGFGGGFMNVEADSTRKIKVKSVCLEHGKDDPSPRIEYAIKPIESFTDKADVHEVCKMLGRGEVPQNVAQAAAWHLMDGLSWAQLAAKDRVFIRRTGYREKFFSRQELQLAGRAIQVAHTRAEQNADSSDSLASQDVGKQVVSEQVIGQD